jgi:hypothetical protein
MTRAGVVATGMEATTVGIAPSIMIRAPETTLLTRIAVATQIEAAALTRNEKEIAQSPATPRLIVIAAAALIRNVKAIVR